MAVPRSHLAKGRQGRRRSHLALKKKSLVECSNCKKKRAPHTVCKNCGYYKGTEIINVLAKLTKKEKKIKEKEIKQAETKQNQSADAPTMESLSQK